MARSPPCGGPLRPAGGGGAGSPAAEHRRLVVCVCVCVCVVVCCSVVKSRPTLYDPMDCSTLLSSTVSRSLLKLTSIESVMPSSQLVLCHPLLLLPSILLSIRGFSKESALRIN